MSIADPAPPGGRAIRVGDLSEEELLAVITPLLPRGPQTPVGAGDDCAVLSFPDARTAVSTDVLVEGHHFRTEWSTGRDVGARAAAQNLADAAAMGARPVALVIGLVMPPTTPVAWVRDFAQGHQSGPRLTGRTPEDPLVQDSLSSP